MRTAHVSTHRSISFILAIVLGSILFAELAAAGPVDDRNSADKAQGVLELTDIPLVWKPTDTISALGAIDLTAFQNAAMQIKPFTDLRLKPNEIGQNAEKRLANKVLYVTTKDSVALWLTDRFKAIMQELNVPVAAGSGNLTLEGDIVKFYVTEESTYKAEIGVKIRLRSKNGDVAWEGMITATAKRWGASYKAENYYEILSNTCIDVVYNLLKSDAFLQAVKKHK